MYQSIIHATDLSEDHFEMCKKAQKIAHHFRAKLHLLHVIHTPSSLQFAQSLGFAELTTPNKENAISVMTLLGEALSIPQSQQHVEIGSIDEQVLNKVNELKSNLIILGKHNSKLLQAFIGSTAYVMLLHAPCDVLTLYS